MEKNKLLAPAIIYANFYNAEKSYGETKTKHTPSGYSLFTNCSLNFAKKKA